MTSHFYLFEHISRLIDEPKSSKFSLLPHPTISLQSLCLDSLVARKSLINIYCPPKATIARKCQSTRAKDKREALAMWERILVSAPNERKERKGFLAIHG